MDQSTVRPENRYSIEDVRCVWYTEIQFPRFGTVRMYAMQTSRSGDQRGVDSFEDLYQNKPGLLKFFCFARLFETIYTDKYYILDDPAALRRGTNDKRERAANEVLSGVSSMRRSGGSE